MNMNRIENLFGKKHNNLLSVFFTAGYPHADSTVPVIKALEAGGVDMVEVGIPFSDPMADGAVIQQSSSVALRNGMTLCKLLEQVKEARTAGCEIPIVLMGYLNPIYKFGVEKFFISAKEAGADALIIPDLPFGEYMEQYRDLCRKYDLPMIMLITPETSDERIRMIDDNCDGFIYMVSSASTTGVKSGFTPEQKRYFSHINGMDLKHHRLIGFGISNHRTYNDACANSSGAIIGSKFIKCLDENPTPQDAVIALIKAISPTDSEK